MQKRIFCFTLFFLLIQLLTSLVMAQIESIPDAHLQAAVETTLNKAEEEAITATDAKTGVSGVIVDGTGFSRCGCIVCMCMRCGGGCRGK